MNNNEGISLAKMAISVMLVILVMGAVVSLFWLMYRGVDKYADNTRKDTVSTTKALLTDLVEQSISADASYALSDTISNLDSRPDGWPEQDKQNYLKIYNKHPLTTTVANAIGNYMDTDVVFVYITLLNDHTKLSELYTAKDFVPDYNFSSTPGVSNSDVVFLEYYDPSTTVIRNEHEDLLAPAVKRLLQYSQYRCHVETMQIKEKNAGGNVSNYTGIKVLILDDEGLR